MRAASKRNSKAAFREGTLTSLEHLANREPEDKAALAGMILADIQADSEYVIRFWDQLNDSMKLVMGGKLD